ncbi:MAG TPA: methyltransferase domain-containing protein [Caldilineae bacterium]|nr:methyltransferase domain-containing protein [Caldilineae bacterium]
MCQGQAGGVIRRYYDQQPEAEWGRLERHRTEFAVTLRALEEHLPPPPAKVLDCGGGPGRYAIELARRGYEVTLFDLSAGCLQMARERAAEAGVTLAGYEQGTATDLARFPDETFDAVLLMGPLYHLLGEKERRQALAEARRVLKPGGPLFAAFISRYAPLRYVAIREPTWPLEQPERLEMLLTTGILPPRGVEGPEFVAHFAHPTEVIPLCRGEGFEIVTVLGVEGLVSMIEEQVNALSGEAWDAWVDLNYRVARDPSIHGCVEHLLVVAVKPRWQAVLRRVARQLNQAGVAYKVVGGASAALHGVPILVKDIDIEMDAEDVYRFQALFADHAIEPVALREGETYRSHFGRFDFEGVAIEVMGDLQRREGENWVPTAATTETTVDLDGVPVRVSWLEEETLAYIRRGRLNRAAQCLPHCDHGRLLALLRGERATGVL